MRVYFCCVRFNNISILFGDIRREERLGNDLFCDVWEP